jgi:hypothetical protein
MEYAFREDETLLRKYPRMGGSVTVPAGTYRLTACRASYPKGLVDARFRAEASPWELRLWNSMRHLIPLAVAAWIGLIVICFTHVRVPFPNFLAPALGLIFALPFLIRQHETYRAARRRFARVEQGFPFLVAQLERIVAFIE